MATETFEIRIVTRGTARSKRQIEGIGKSAGKSLKILGQLRAGLVIFASARVLSGLVTMADSFVNLQNRLQASLGSMTAATGALNAILEISIETRTSLEATGDAFARLALSGGELGLTISDMVTVTRTLNKAIILSGASAEEARNAMIQLSQGIASGALRGDELRSVLEQLPLVARLIAKEFGVAVGELRILGEQGKLVAERIVLSMQNASAEIDEAFKGTTVTVGQAFTVLETAFTFFLSQLSQSTGTANALASSLGGLAESLLFLGKNTEIVAGVFAGLISLGLIPLIGFLIRITGLGNAVSLAATGMGVAFIEFSEGAKLATISTTFFTTSVNFLIAALTRLIIPIGVTLGVIALLNIDFKKVTESIKDAKSALEDLNTVFDATKLNLTTKQLNQRREEILENIKREKTILAKLEDQLIISGGPDVPRGRDFGEISQDIRELSRRLTTLIDDLFAVDRATPKELGKNFSPQIQKVIKDLTFANEQLKRNTDGLEINSLQLKINKNIRKAGAKDNAEARKEIEDLTIAIFKEIQARKARAETFGISVAKAIQQDKERLAALKSGQEIIKQLDRDAIDLLNKNISLKEKQLVVETKLELQRERLISLGFAKIEVDAAISKELNRQTDALLRQHAAQQKVLTGDERRLLELTGDKSAAAGLERGFLKMRIDAADTSKFVEEAFTSTFSKMGDALAEFATTGKLDFREFANSMLQDLNRIIAKAFLSNLFSGASGGSFNFGGILAKLFAGGGGGLPTAGGGGSPIGFAKGGQFTVGGSGGADSQFVPLQLTPGELVTIDPDGRSGGTTVVMNINTPDANSFRLSQTQIVAEAAAILQRANRRNR